MIYLSVRRRRIASLVHQPRVVRALRIALIAAALCPLPLLYRAFVKAKSATTNRSFSAARLSEQVTLRAVAGRDPTVNLSDGHNLLTSYAGPDDLRIALEQNQAAPLSLASADFDEDGVPDLVSGYSYNGQGIVTLLRGNVDSIYPNAPAAQQRKANGTFTNAPFLAPAIAISAPVAADFLGAGDFDADGHWDVVIGSRARDSLFLLRGDGHGGLSLAREITLPGVVTALTTGEINRADGLTDIVVGVEHAGLVQVLVFEGPAGALQSQPEVFAMPAPVNSLQLAQLDGEYTRDLAIAAGDTLVIVQGRDRKLSLDENERARVSPAVRSERHFESTIAALAVGNFAADAQTDVTVGTSDGVVQVLSSDDSKTARIDEWSTVTITGAKLSPTSELTTARVSTSSYDDLIITDESDNHLQLLHSPRTASTDPLSADPLLLEANNAPIAVLPMRLTPSALNSLIVLQKNQNTPAVAAIEPNQTFTVTNTSATGTGSLQFAILDANETPGADLIRFDIPGTGPFIINVTAALPTITDPVTIDATTQQGFQGTPIVQLNGTQAGKGPNGFVLSAGNSVVRGMSISGFDFNPNQFDPVTQDGGGAGISVRSNNNLIEGNGFGIVPFMYAGVRAVGPALNNTVGGTTPAARNVTTSVFLAVLLPPGADNNKVQGNLIGGGRVGIGDQFGGAGGTSNTIGGTIAGARNVIAKGSEVRISGNGNLVQGNYIGTDESGNAASNPATSEFGVQFYVLVSGNTVGGTTAAARNVISANGQAGIRAASGGCISCPTDLNLVQGNFIGTKADGTGDLGNTQQGVVVDGSGLFNIAIGGTTPGARNIISNNKQSGIEIRGTGTHIVQGNFIGTDVSGTADLGNVQNGVYLNNTPNNVVGGTGAGAGNVLSGNGLNGVLIEGTQATGNSVQGNYIGTNAAGTAAIGNDLNGVTTSQAPNNTIGGATVEARNIISANARHGVSIGIDTNSGATGITVQNNYIGTDVTGNNCLGNGRDGVFVNRGSVNHTITDNLITCNGRDGVNIPNFASNDPGIQIKVIENAIFANASLGIDLGDAGITANDLQDTDSGANLQQNFPLLTSSSIANSDKPELSADALMINGTLNSTPQKTFTVHWYFTAAGQCASNQASNRPLVTGKVSDVKTDAAGDAQFSFPFDFPTGVDNGIINCTATDSQGNTSEFSACFQVGAPSNPSPTPTPTPAPTPMVQFSAASFGVNENAGPMVVTVSRVGNSTGQFTVKYATSDTGDATNCGAAFTGKASSRCDYTTTIGTLKFASGETTKNLTILVVDDSYSEADESLTVTLTDPVGASLGSTTTATATIHDDELPGQSGPNPINQPGPFVRFHYYDFLSRDPDTAGLNFWRDQITSCGSDAGCTEVRRINVSASFFLSIEFQQTGYLVERTYKVSFGDIDKNSNFPQPTHTIKVPIIRFTEFLADTQQITQGVVVLAPGWEQQLENNKVAFFNEFVQRSRFTTALPTTLTPTQFVDALNTNAGNVLSANEKTTAINLFGGAGNTSNTTARAQALRQVAEDADLNTAEFNRAFVLMQYFGYLRRNPDDPQDTDYSGYEFWLIKLNQFGGNYINAEMVKAFLSSIEYNRRFGP